MCFTNTISAFAMLTVGSGVAFVTFVAEQLVKYLKEKGKKNDGLAISLPTLFNPGRLQLVDIE